MKRCGAVLLLTSLLAITPGCIAAAIPLAAGAAVVRTRDRAPAVPAAQDSAASNLRITPLALAELPPPDAASSSVSSTIAAFRDYTLAQLALQPGAKRPSALLTRAADLKADRAACAPSSIAVFVDLDHGRSTFDPLAPGRSDPAFGAALSDLRAGGVEVVWFSRLSESFAEATRAALAAAGLDPTGSDRLVLLRDLGERKQSRRDEVAKTVCPLAMIGDERADFDELYLYLKQPEAALALDAMIGRGWFLASPFAPAAPDRPTAENVP